LINSNGQLEIFLKESSAASLLHLGKKEAVRLT
jgi:S-adenosylmethionine hydrolase